MRRNTVQIPVTNGQMEKLWLELGLGPAFSSTSPLSLKIILKNQK